MVDLLVQGYIYGSEIARGVDVFKLVPNKFITQNEIDAAKTVHMTEFNVQNQEKIEWPRTLVVAKAYVDQLERSQALPADRIAALRNAIQKAESSNMSSAALGALRGNAQGLEMAADKAKNAADANRMKSLAEILKRPAR